MSATTPSIHLNAAALQARLAAADFSGCRATLVGYGNMGKQYYKALRALGVRHIRVCAFNEPSLAELRGVDGVEALDVGIDALDCRPEGDELAIVAVPIDLLISASEKLAALGFRNLLVEKPVSLESAPIRALAEAFDRLGVRAACAYNRAVYPSVLEVKARAAEEGGITSCTYVFTEMIKPDWPDRFPASELARWGVANSLHVMSLAHAMIGWPKTWHAARSGAISWHPSGAVFVGAGQTVTGIPFSYHADWSAKGRWVVEVHTAVSSYRLCPLEKVLRRVTATGEWEPVEITAFASDVKAGIVEEVAAMLGPVPELRSLLPTLSETAELTAYGEDVFGY